MGKFSQDEVSLYKSLTCPPYRLKILFINNLLNYKLSQKLCLLLYNQNTLTLTLGTEIILHCQTWEDYENLLGIRQEKTIPKIYFNGKKQKNYLMSPLSSQGNRIDILRDLIKSLLRQKGKDWHCFDPITLKAFNLAGIEPDTCF